MSSRFRNEAAAAGKLRHKNIVTVYEFGDHEGKPFLVMEYLEGEDLHRIISSRKPLTLLEKVGIMSQVAEGLHCAHQNGVLHRDVKPANIMILRDGNVKIMDFGIAKVLREDIPRVTRKGDLIGTMLYMAPEQFGAMDADALCDLFAYGVIYYELLTGKHPFRAPDAAAMMYKITAEVPEPVRNLAPECPAELDELVHRALQKDRDLRYQNMREILVDAEPIRIALQQERAAELIARAQAIFEKQDLAESQRLLLEGLDLDPFNRTGRKLRESLQKALQRAVLQPRVETLLKTAAIDLAARRFAEAVQGLESAMRLDSGNPEVAVRLAEAQQWLERNRKANRLLAEARKDYHQGDLKACREKVEEAFREDPGQLDAPAILKRLDTEIRAREKEQKLKEELSTAGALVALHSFDEAIASLVRLTEEYPESKEAGELLARARAEKVESDRRRRLKTELACAADLLRERQYEKAVAVLEDLNRDFPDEPEAADLLGCARHELQAQRRTEAITALSRQVASKVEAREFESALQSLEQARKEYPGDTSVLRMLHSTRSAQAAWERQRRIEAVLSRSQELERELRFAEALDAVVRGIREHGADAVLVSRRSQIDEAWAQHRRQQAIQAEVRHARELLDSGAFEAAIAAARRSLEEYPGEPSLASLLSEAEAALRAKVASVAAVVRDVRALASNREWDRALETIESGLATYPGNEEFLAVKEETLAAKGSWEREQAIEAVCRDAREAIGRGELEPAIARLRRGVEEYAGDQRLQVLLEEAEGALRARREAVASLAAQARNLAASESFEAALQLLAGGLAEYPGESGLDAARNEIERQQARAVAIARLRSEAEALCEAREFDRAVATVDSGRQAYPDGADWNGLRDRVRDAKAAWEREQGIEAACSDAREAIGRGELEPALARLRRGIADYPGDERLETLLEDAEGRLRARREEIASFQERARELAALASFDAALELLAGGLAKYPGESGLEAARSEIERQQARAIAIARVRNEVEALCDDRDFGRAFQTIDAARAAYPDGTAWDSLQERAGVAKSAWEREQGIEAACREAREAVERGELEAAIARLCRGLDDYPGEPRLCLLLDQTEEARRARVDEIASLEAKARALAESRSFDKALKLLADGLAKYPGDGVLEAARRELERDRRVALATATADSKVRENRHQEALAAVDEALRDVGSHRILDVLRERIEQQWDRYKRDEELRDAADAARALVGRGHFAEAAARLERALASYPDEQNIRRMLADVQARQNREEAIVALCAEAAERLKAEDFDGASALLQEGAASYPDDGRVAEAARAVVQAKEEWRKKKALALVEAGGELLLQHQYDEAVDLLRNGKQQLGGTEELGILLEKAERKRSEHLAAEELAARAGQLAAEKKLDAALELLEKGAASYPGEPAVLEARERVSRQKEEWEREQAVLSAAHRAEALRNEGRIEEALDVLARGLAACGAVPLLNGLRRQLEEALDRKCRREEDVARLRQADADMRMNPDPRDLEAPARASREAAARWPGDQDIGSVASALTRQAEAISQVRQALDARDCARAGELCDAWLRDYPGHAYFIRVKRECEERRKQDMAAFLAALHERLAAEPDLESRIAILQDGLRQYPDEPRLHLEMRFHQSRRLLVNSIVDKARAHEEAGEYEEALEQWNALKSAYRQYRGLDDEIRRVRALRDRQRDEAKANWLRCIGQELEAGNFAHAAGLLGMAQAEFPEDRELHGMEGRLASGREAAKLLAEADGLCGDRRYEEACRSFALAHKQNGIDGKWRGRVLEDLLGHASAIAATDWRSAERMLREARSLDPRWPIPNTLPATVERCKQDELVQGCLEDVARLEAEGHPDRALARLGEGLRAYPRHNGLLERRAALQGRNAGPRSRQSLPPGAEELHSPPTMVLPAPRQAARPAGSPVRHARRPWIWLVAGIVFVAVLFAAIATRSFFTGRAGLRSGVRVEIRTSVPGATVRLGQRSYVTPDCRMDLAPGEYQVTISKDGYEPVAQRFVLDPRGLESARTLQVELTPLAQSVQVISNFASGTVALDGRAAGRLRDGQFTAAGIRPGRHALMVSSPDGEVNVQFHTAPGLAPEVTGPLSARGVKAIVATEFAGKVRLYCNCEGTRVGVDGGAPVELGRNAVELGNLSESVHELQVAEGLERRTVVMAVRGAPSVSLFLTADRNVGTLVVETGQPGARVFLNGRLYGGNGAGPVVRIPAEVHAYEVRVEKQGYQQPPPQRVELRKGEEKRVAFRLVPLPQLSSLAVRGALPGTEILLDGKPLGSVAEEGTFSASIKPGGHTVDLVRGRGRKQFHKRFEAGAIVALGKDEVALMEPAQPPALPAPPVVGSAPVTHVPVPGSAPAAAPTPPDISEWQRISKGRNVSELRDFVRKFPNSALAGQAQQLDWEATRLGGKAQLRAFLDAYGPQGRFSAEAASALRRLEQTEQAAAEAKAIADMMARYALAWQSKSAEELTAIFPALRDRQTLGVPLREFLRDNTFFDYVLKPDGEPKITGDRAVLTCKRSFRQKGTAGRLLPREDNVVFTLRRVGGNWQIEGQAGQ